MQHILTASGYKCGLLTIESRRIRNVGNLFSVSFSRLLTRYSAATKAAGEDEIRLEMLKALNGERERWLTKICQVRGNLEKNQQTGMQAVA